MWNINYVVPVDASVNLQYNADHSKCKIKPYKEPSGASMDEHLNPMRMVNSKR